MKLETLLKSANIIPLQGVPAGGIDVAGIACDSREVSPGILFVAVRGASRDGHVFLADAIRRGACAVIVEDAAFLAGKKISAPCITVENSKDALLRIAGAWFGFPYEGIKCVGITGTNGKTTVSYLVKSILDAAGQRCGLIGTIGHRVGEEDILSHNTTPGVLELHGLLRGMIDAGHRYVAMEVSSHALDQGRVAGMIFEAVVFTNLTRDHLDYHRTMEEYFLAKQGLFVRHAGEKTVGIINRDDPYGRRLLDSAEGKIFSYGFSPSADVGIVDFDSQRDGSRAAIRTPAGDMDIRTLLVGKHNLCNILAAAAFGISQGLDLKVIKEGLEAVRVVPGRLERIDSRRGFSVFVDYAHTDDALKNVLESLRPLSHNGRIIVVFGCGGDRDRGKRPQMGRVASDLADYCVLTSDNPRSEDPEAIIADIKSGIPGDNFCVETDRRRAIEKALRMARERDIVLLAGKGHETYQIIKERSVSFDDKTVVREILSDIEGHV